MALRLVGMKPKARQAPADEPARVCLEGRIRQPFHYWRGATGMRYLHTVYSLIDCPEMPKANYLLVHRDSEGNRMPLAVGQTTDDVESLNLAHLRCVGARLGANEIHLHVLSETRVERDTIEADVRAGQFARLAEQLKPLVANPKITPIQSIA